MNGIDIRRPSQVRWDSSSPQTPFVVQSKVMPNKSIQVWRTDGFKGIMPRSDWRILTETKWPEGRVHHMQNWHNFGYTRYSVKVISTPPPAIVVDFVDC